MNARLTRLMHHERRWGRDGTGPHRLDVIVCWACVVAFLVLLAAGRL